MNSLTRVYLFLFIIFSSTNVGDVRFSAITDVNVWHLNRLYYEEWSEDPPAKWDPAATDESTRRKLCQDICNSGVFDMYSLYPVHTSEMQADAAGQAGCSSSMSRGESRLDETYAKPYSLREFEIRMLFPSSRLYSRYPRALLVERKKDFVFVCPLRSLSSKKIVPLYVSKAYSHFREFHRVYRYVRIDEEQDVMLAEESAKVIERPGFNVELHYLALKKRHQQASAPEHDPVCVLSGETIEEDQSFRLCVIVLTSSYFSAGIRYLHRVHTFQCLNKEIAFKTEEGIQMAAGESHREFMLRCSADTVTQNSEFYISRAYNPNQVFLYIRDFRDDKFYLKNLSIDVNIVQERFRFGDVEE